ncbi:MAG: response regulator [Planctomycetota bacterium]|jgi:CheY-like chemotaxis protein
MDEPSERLGEATADDQRATILVVDDEAFIRDLVRDTLETRGYTTHQASNGDEALLCLERETIDIMITDVVMPGMPGLDLVKRVRHDFPGIHMIVLTGYARDQDIGDFLLEGADDLLPKPFRANDLVEVIRGVEKRLRRGRDA